MNEVEQDPDEGMTEEQRAYMVEFYTETLADGRRFALEAGCSLDQLLQLEIMRLLSLLLDATLPDDHSEPWRRSE